MCSKSGTTTQTQTIPPEVLARYKSINKYAEQVAKTPFQQYTGDFVANLTPTQLAGIKATNQYSQYAQPYYRNATQQLNQAQQQGMNRLNQSYNPLYEGMDAGEMMGNIARRQYMGAQGQAMPYYDAAAMGLGAALDFSQPYLGGATGAAYAGAEAITPEQLNIQGFMNPYTQAVAQTTQQALNQQQQEQAAGQIGNAIRSGGFGGDRAGLAAANLARQQQQGMAQAMAPIYQQGYSQALGSALSTAQANRAALQNLSQQLQGIGQQGYAQQMGGAQFAQQLGQGLYGMAMGTGQAMQGLGQQQFAQGLSSAQQLAALAQQGYGMGSATAQQLAALGAGGQQAALQGAQAQLGAGTLAQQTKQAELTANYQQFLQERGYPFQVAQFLANIAMGTGALSGSTTTTTQPMPFFSDRRVKEDVKEIGETHDGQPIYSFKYKGDDATRIGLMAQDVEKKHPDAVYDMGGVKGVDYKQATEDSERPERYAGGLVPASMGGAVTEPGAYNRGGYSPGGLVDPNDLQAILAQQQQAFGPFGEGGIYGASHHEAPFSGAKGIVPQARLHTPKLREMGPAPRLPDSGVQQAVSAFDTAMGMKDRYEKAKGLLSGEKTPQKQADESRPNLTTKEEVKNLAGPDIKAPSSGEDQGWIDWLREKTGLADGGVVPRQGYASGSYVNPYDKAEDYFPEESLEESSRTELPKSGQNPSQTSKTGLGLGEAIYLGSKLIPFLPFNDGGSVPRHGYATDGGVWDPTMNKFVEASEMTPEKIAELNKGDVYSRELQPSQAPYLRAFERFAKEEGAKGVAPTELYRSPERSAFLDLTMPEGAPRAKPYSSGHNFGFAGDYSGITPLSLSKTKMTRGVGEAPTEEGAVRRAAKMAGVTLGADFSNPDPPHVQRTAGSFGSLAPRHGEVINLPPGAQNISLKGAVDPELQDAAYAKAREVLAAKGIEPASEEGQSMMPKVVSFLEKNQGWLVPFGAGLKGMVQSRSPFLGAAILEGLGTGMEAVGASQQQLAELAKTKAGVIQTLSGISGPLIGEFDKNGKPIYRPQYKYMPDFTEAPTEGLGETQTKTIEQSREAVNNPIVVKNDGGQYNWDVVPTSKNDETFASIGFKPTGNPNLDAQKLNVIFKMQPQVAATAAEDFEVAEKRKQLANNTPQTKRETNALTGAIMNLPEPGTVAGGGPGFDQRTYAVNIYNWVSKFFGVDAIDFNSPEMKSVTAQEISNKIKTLLSSRTTSEQGFSGQQLAEDIRRALPGGDMTVGARAEMLASMWIVNQEAEDFARYYQAYTQKYKTAYGVNQAFQRDMAPKYDAMKSAIKKAITPQTYQTEEIGPNGERKIVTKTLVDESGVPFSEYNVLMNDNDPFAFDKLVGMPGLARVFRGG